MGSRNAVVALKRSSGKRRRARLARSRNAVVALKHVYMAFLFFHLRLKQERRGGIETSSGTSLAVRAEGKQERRGGIETASV